MAELDATLGLSAHDTPPYDWLTSLYQEIADVNRPRTLSIFDCARGHYLHPLEGAVAGILEAACRSSACARRRDIPQHSWVGICPPNPIPIRTQDLLMKASCPRDCRDAMPAPERRYGLHSFPALLIVASDDGSGRDEAENPERVFLDHLDTIERAIGHACRRGSLRDEDAEDFASWVKVKLIDKDYAVIRKYERRASFAGFISVVVQRLLLDYRIGQWGKWHASAEARRMGEPAITIEAMLYRDGRTIDEVFPMLLRRWPELDRGTVETIARRLRPRVPRARAVDLETVTDTLTSIVSSDDQRMFETERVHLARRIAAVIRETIHGLEPPERLIFRLRFEGGMSVAEVSRVLRIEQKPLYRSVQRTLALLRKRLHAAGVSAADIEELIESRSIDLDFGFDETAGQDGSAIGGEGP